MNKRIKLMNLQNVDSCSVAALELKAEDFNLMRQILGKFLRSIPALIRVCTILLYS